jgi:hypothetical protein
MSGRLLLRCTGSPAILPPDPGLGVSPMRRRDFIILFGVVAAAGPRAARAQQAAVPVIGFLDLRSPEALTDRLRGFRQGLRESGYVEGDNVTVVQSTTKATTVYCAAAGDQG